MNKDNNEKNTIKNSEIKAGGNVHIGDIHYHNTPPKAESSSSNAIEQIKMHLASNETKEAIECLQEWAKGDSKKMQYAIMYAAQWKGVKNDKDLGIIGNENATVAINSLRSRMLSYLSDFE